MPVTDRYVEESGRPDRVYAARFDPNVPLFDYTQTHFAAQPSRIGMVEKAARFVTNKIVGIPNHVMDEVLTPAFIGSIDEIIEHRLQHPIVQLADHAPNQLPVATQLAGNLALAASDRLAGRTTGKILGGLIQQSHGIGTVGFRPLGIRPIPKGPGHLIGSFARWATNTHYSIPSTEQYRKLALNKEDRKRYNGAFAMNLINAMQQPVEDLPPNTGRKVHPANLYPECVINPVGTKQVQDGDRIIIPRAHWATGKLVEALGAAILPVYTAFWHNEQGKIAHGYSEVGDIVLPPAEGEGGKVVDNYLTELAAFRAKYEDREVVYADAPTEPS